MELFSKSSSLKVKDEEEGGVGERGGGEEDTHRTGSSTDFRSLGLFDWVHRTCDSLGMTTPTPVQAACVPKTLEGCDIVACARTGTGKTASFALPVLHRLSEDPYGVFALVLTPSRELAFQIRDQFLALGGPLRVRVAVVVGGMSTTRQMSELSQRPHVIVATPGRFADLLRTVAKEDLPPLRRLRFLILDEADRLLERNFRPDLSTILSACSESKVRQTLLYSATLALSDVDARDLGIRQGSRTFRFDELETDSSSGGGTLSAGLAAGDAAAVEARKQALVARTVEGLRQRYLFLPSRVRLAYLYELLLVAGPAPEADSKAEDAALASLKMAKRQKRREIEKERKQKKKKEEEEEEEEDGKEKGGGGVGVGAVESEVEVDEVDEDIGWGVEEETGRVIRASAVIVFAGTVRDCEITSETLRELGWLTASLHSAMRQEERLSALAKFKAGLVHVLIATDVASRGLDIPSVDLVVHLHLPRNPDDYVHRAGRTARAGRGGRSVALVTERDVGLVHAIEQVTHVKMTLEHRVVEEAILPHLTRVAAAQRVARLRLSDKGFEAKLEAHAKRKKDTRARARAFEAEEEEEEEGQEGEKEEGEVVVGVKRKGKVKTAGGKRRRNMN